jgi:hypothetical protein
MMVDVDAGFRSLCLRADGGRADGCGSQYGSASSQKFAAVERGAA